MNADDRIHRLAVFQALLVTFLWSTSWVLIKIGLVDLPPITFAGLRYTLAFFILLPFTLHASTKKYIRGLSTRQWAYLVLLGILLYSIVQGVLFFGLAYLPAASISLILNFTTLVVVGMGMVWLNEKPGLVSWIGILMSFFGGLVFFYPAYYSASQSLALFIVVLGMLTNAASAVLGRHINHHEKIPALVVTTISMGVGGTILLIAGTYFQGIPQLELKHILIILWLAIINTAFAFTLWNHTMRVLLALESSIINSTMLVQIALLAWIFLGESLTVKEWAGMFLAGLGVLLVQLQPLSKSA